MKKKKLPLPIKKDRGFQKMVCTDCIERPTFIIKQVGFKAEEKFCNRHLHLFSKEFDQWFLGEGKYGTKRVF